jgi:SSS family solute:Na+ symporter
MATYGILANEPVYYGLLSSLVAYVIVSLATPATDPAVLAAWRERLAGRGADAEAEAEPTAVVA